MRPYNNTGLFFVYIQHACCKLSPDVGELRLFNLAAQLEIDKRIRDFRCDKPFFKSANLYSCV